MLSKLKLLIIFLITSEVSLELLQLNEIERLCYPKIHQNTRKACECIEESNPSWGLRAVNIDCSFKDFLTSDLTEELPLFTDILHLNWNALETIPQLSSDSLRLLNLMHNNISLVTGNNFIKIKNLIELYLSWNSLQIIEPNAFEGLNSLQILDLSHNNLIALESNIFLPLQLLDSLYLSWNRNLNETKGIQEIDFYTLLGINDELKVLRLQSCSLNNTILPESVPLQELDLRHNALKRIPEFLPDSLEKLDISDNLLETLQENDTKHLTHLREFFMDDMLYFTTIEEKALFHLKSVEKLSFQNNRRLKRIHERAFGANATHSPSLHSIIFRGSALHSFNVSLATVFHQLTTLDLNGVPLRCDCQLAWLKELTIETNGRCIQPPRLRGLSLRSVRSKDFSCETWPRWLTSIIIFSLIIVCSLAIYLIVIGLRPFGNVVMRRKIGVNSPYARVTIEPNRQDSY
uniref:LRRCT domain-containing protein n=1 Tax=Glossina brevipalpis TaxID=37001 RepID=A0A1A9WP36_9MUSC